MLEIDIHVMSTNAGGAASGGASATAHSTNVSQARLRTKFCDFLVQMGRCDNASMEIPQIELFIRRVRVLIGKADTEQDARDAEFFLKRRHDRNGSALAGKYRRLTEPLFNCASGRAYVRAVELGHPWLSRSEGTR